MCTGIDGDLNLSVLNPVRVDVRPDTSDNRPHILDIGRHARGAAAFLALAAFFGPIAAKYFPLPKKPVVGVGLQDKGKYIGNDVFWNAVEASQKRLNDDPTKSRRVVEATRLLMVSGRGDGTFTLGASDFKVERAKGRDGQELDRFIGISRTGKVIEVGFDNGIPLEEIDPDSDKAITGVLVVNPANKVCLQIKGIGPLRDHEYHRGSNYGWNPKGQLKFPGDKD